MENKPKEYADLCLYYKKEKRNPFKPTDMRSTYWELEQMWVTMVLTNISLDLEYTRHFAFDFPDNLDEISRLVPISLKSFMYDRYCAKGGTKYGFKDWFDVYVKTS